MSSWVIKELFIGVIAGVVGAYMNEFFRNKPNFSLCFDICNKNFDYYNIKVGLRVVKGHARDIKWKVGYTGENEELKNYFNLQQGSFEIMKENESRFLFDIRSDVYKNGELFKNTYILIEHKILKIIPCKQKLNLDLKQYLSFEDAIKNKDLIELSSHMRLEAKKAFKQLIENDNKTN